ncbi:MAG: AAA family ATPase [Gaiellaceae bacterium]
MPRVADVDPSRLRIHSAQVEVPYILRDAEDDLHHVLRTRRPVAVVGHSMAGKTALAWNCVQTVFPHAQLLAPMRGGPLRELTEAGLELKDVVVWLDDLERFLKGDDALDSALIDRLIGEGAIVVATIRRNEASRYRSSNESRSPSGDVLRRFRRVSLQRRLTNHELVRVRDQVKDAAVLAGVSRYGLAEYVGAGPEALDRFADGESVCPLGHALVRVAVDWRRAGFARYVLLDVLIRALPIYLEDRPDVEPGSDAIKDGLAWATEKINETVGLLTIRRADGADDGPAYEAFDYLVDVAEEDETPIPPAMWQLVVGEASPTETLEIERSAFYGREKVLAELLRWLNSRDDVGGGLLVITGAPGAGKSAILARLVVLASPPIGGGAVRDDPAFALRPEARHIDVALSAKGQTANDVIAALARGAVQSDETAAGTLSESSATALAVLKARRSLIVVVDAIDEAVEPVPVARELARLASEGTAVIVGTRKYPEVLDALQRAHVVDLDADTYRDPHEVEAFVRRMLSTRAESPYRDNPSAAELVAREVAHVAGHNFLYARLTTEELIRRPLVVEPTSVAQLAFPTSVLDAVLARLNALGPDRRYAEPLLAALAFANSDLSEDAWLQAARDLGDEQVVRSNLVQLLSSPAGELVSVNSGEKPTYRLYHAAIAEALVELWGQRQHDGV